MFIQPAMPPVNVKTSHDLVIVENGRLSLKVAKATGRFSLEWVNGAASLLNAHGELRYSPGNLKRTDARPTHLIETKPVHDKFGKGVLLVVHNKGGDSEELRQSFWVYEGKSEAIIQLTYLDSTGTLRANYMAPIVTDSVSIAHSAPLQCLGVPYDNDAYDRYRSDGWVENAPEGSYEVGAIYDDSTRLGLVAGSIDHDLWKSAVKFSKVGGLTVFAGATGSHTRDKLPHGVVMGNPISSPRFSIGQYSDWRTGLERFGALNALVQKPLAWEGPVPTGWNSWSGHKSEINNDSALAAINFIDKELPWLRTGGTAYVNFDSFWDNLSRKQRIEFCHKAHAAGLKAGIYWTPFVNWGEPDSKAIGKYKYKDLQLKDKEGELLPKLDSGWPLDPTHPGTLARIDATLKDFVDQGFDYIKLDFTTHGALEGEHYDKKITTGTAAYRVGMQRIVEQLSLKKVGRPIFISLSIAPLFPHGYGHARRLSCDVFSNIGASEYFLNSQNYAWWQAKSLYPFVDADSACVYQALGEPPTMIEEGRTRFTASVIGGGMMIEGDNLTNPKAIERVKEIFGNREALELAWKTPDFRPVNADMGEGSGDIFYWKEDDDSYYIALFNFNRTDAVTKTVKLDRLGITGEWKLHELWSRADVTINDQIVIRLKSRDCALIHLKRSRS